MQKYRDFVVASLHPKFLDADSKKHTSLLGAMAEFVDNSADANARSVKITTEDYKDGNEFMLVFQDDGDGISPDEAKEIFLYGKTSRQSTPNKIGINGVGLKSASMRLSKDMIIFTRKNSVNTIILLSRRFLEEEKLEQIIIPMPSFVEGLNIYVNDQSYFERIQDKVNKELEVIFKYSPFNSYNQISQQFADLGDKGTKVILYGMMRKANFDHELDVKSTPNDMLISNENNGRSEFSSLREYLSVLYSEPRMKIYIQGEKVLQKYLKRAIYLPRKITKEFHGAIRKKAEDEYNRKKNEIANMKGALNEQRSDNINHLLSANASINKKRDIEFRKKMQKTYTAEDLRILELEADAAKKAINAMKPIDYIIGVHLRERVQDGLFIYNNGRLVKIAEYPKDMQAKYAGIIGLVDIPYSIVEPRADKQSLSNENEENKIIGAFKKLVPSFYNVFEEEVNNVPVFWMNMGYLSETDKLPMNNYNYLKSIHRRNKRVTQCNDCLKWRTVYEEPGTPIKIDNNWKCIDNADHCDQQETFYDIKQMTVLEDDFGNPRTPQSAKGKGTQSARSSAVSTDASWVDELLKSTDKTPKKDDSAAKRKNVVEIAGSTDEETASEPLVKRLREKRNVTKETNIFLTPTSTTSKTPKKSPATPKTMNLRDKFDNFREYVVYVLDKLDPTMNFENYSDEELVNFDKHTFTERKFKELFKAKPKPKAASKTNKK